MRRTLTAILLGAIASVVVAAMDIPLALSDGILYVSGAALPGLFLVAPGSGQHVGPARRAVPRMHGTTTRVTTMTTMMEAATAETTDGRLRRDMVCNQHTNRD